MNHEDNGNPYQSQSIDLKLKLSSIIDQSMTLAGSIKHIRLRLEQLLQSSNENFADCQAFAEKMKQMIECTNERIQEETNNRDFLQNCLDEINVRLLEIRDLQNESNGVV
jgi:ElaB/YqjD/DUF883 family membrane-anchored ribosome-binding protein